MPKNNENEVLEFDIAKFMKKAMKEAAEKWDKELARMAAEPPKEVEEEPTIDELAEALEEKPPEKLPPKITMRDLGVILEEFEGLSLEKKEDRRAVFDETLRLAQGAKEDLKIKEDIDYYQSYIVNTALRMLTLDDIPRWVATGGLERLRTQVRRIFEPSEAPIDSGLRYKRIKGLAKLLEIPVKKLKEEYVKVEPDVYEPLERED